MKTRAEIDAELSRLENVIPRLVAELPAEEVLEAFAGEAEVLREDGSDPAYVSSRIDCMLSSAGLIPGENEGEPCPPA